MKRLILISLTLLLLLAALISCESSGAPVDTTEAPETSAEESEVPEMITFDPSDYVILYPKDGFKEKYLSLLVSNAIASESGVRVAPKGDSEAEREFEILIGVTDRPESAAAIERLGDGEFIITVINKKIVIVAKDDELYDAVAYRLINSIKNGEIPADLCIIGNTKVLDKVADSLPEGGEISFDLVLTHKRSTVQLRIGDAYAVEFTPESVGLYTQDSKRAELARKELPSELGKKYKASCSYDGEYLRAYLSDPELGLEPWAAFEIKADKLSGEITLGEVSGYGAEISEIEQKEITYAPTGTTYRNNVIPNAADPDILYYEGYYYVYVTGDHYPVYRSADLAKWEYFGVSLPEVSWNIDKRYMWAPDVEYINGKFYMAVSMGEAGFGIAVADRPEGPFVCAGEMPFLTKTIDGHIFVDEDGRIYLYYTSWCDGRAYGIWGVEMEADCLTPKWETEKLIFTPTEDWEKTMNRGGVVEAPYMLKKEGVYYLVYSGSHFEADYAVGYATSDKPLEGFVKSASNPILRGTADTRGTGHCSIIETSAGGMVMIYHVHNTVTSVQPRHVAIDPVRFVRTADGYRLEVCGPTTSRVAIDIFK